MNKSSIASFLAVVVGSMGLLSDASAAGSDCWVDVYDKTDYQGQKQHILGPARMPSLKDLNHEDWSNRIDSLVVGPEAELWLYRQENFEGGLRYPPNHPDALKLWKEKGAPDDQEISFGPGQKEHHLGEMNFHHNTNSLRIECGKPR